MPKKPNILDFLIAQTQLISKKNSIHGKSNTAKGSFGQ